MTKSTRSTRVIAGLKRRFAPGDKLWVGGREWLVDDLIALYQAELDALDVIRVRYAQYLAAVAAERKVGPQCRTTEVALKDSVRAHFGLAAFHEFGWRRPRKTGPKSLAVKFASAEKARETRKLRGTAPRKRRG